ncbi:MAG: LLM class F420-dependent oxidoreductase [Anaerolineales bacterium]|nr:LLM class F420-dependent oxidoreductase [Anaerolineales bacterium]
MRLGIMLGYSGSKMSIPMDLVHEADNLGYHAIWSAEAYGSDAVVPATWIAAQTKNVHVGTAIMQMPGRTPANTAMTAMTLDQLSGGRFILGLGVSGPQVVEGWHGQPYPRKILGYTRDYVAILRKIFAREAPVTHDGEHFKLPYQGDEGLGLGKPLKSILHGRADLPIYIAAVGPNNVALAAEIADGWFPIFFSPERFDDTFRPSIEEGFAKAGNGKSYDQFDIAASVPVIVGDDLEQCYNMVKPFLALYIGGMGAKSKNFYYNLACSYGFEEAADQIQDAYLAGDKGTAMMAVPDALVDMVALVGSKARIKDRFQMWREVPIGTLTLAAPTTIDTMRLMAELVG